MQKVSSCGQLSGDEPGPRVPELPKAGCLLDVELCFDEPPLLADDELEPAGVLDAEVGAEL
jgi:hypothetical protein